MSADAALDVVSIAARRPDTSEELYQKACRPAGPTSVQAWIWREGQAKGRLAVAERELRELEMQRFCILQKTWGTDSDAARDLLMRHGPSGTELGQAQAEVANATEIASVCARMIEHLTRNPPQQGAANGNQNEAHRPRATDQRPGQAPASNGPDARGVSVRPNPVAAPTGGARHGGGVHPAPAANRSAGNG